MRQMSRKTLVAAIGLIAIAFIAVMAAQTPFSPAPVSVPSTTTIPAMNTPVFIQYKQVGLQGGNFTYCSPECRASRTTNTSMSVLSAASLFTTCTSGETPLECYVASHTNSNFCVALCPTTATTTSETSCLPLCQFTMTTASATTSTFCGPIPTPPCLFTTSTTEGTTSSWCGPLCQFNTQTTSTTSTSSYCGPLCHFTQTETTTSFGGLTGNPNHGPATVLILLAAFKDVKPSRSPQDIGNEWNNQVADYFGAVSHGHYHPYADVSGWYTLPNTEAYYGADDNQTGTIDAGAPDQLFPYSFQIANDVIAQADKAGVNFTKYDNVVVVHSGFGEESSHVSNDVWSVTYTYPPNQKPFQFESIVPEFEANGFSTLGVWCTEFGHQQGWPDMFLSTEARPNGPVKTGRWELESLGTWNGNPSGSSPAYTLTINQVVGHNWLSDGHGFQQIYLQNALQAAGPVGNLTVEINNVESNSGNMSIEVLTTGDHGYWIEARSLTGWDAGLPESGIIISTVIHGVADDPNSIYVMNATPSDPTLNHAAFQVGQTFNDGNIKITVVSHNGNIWTLHITV